MRLLLLAVCLAYAQIVSAQGSPPPGASKEMVLDAKARNEVIDAVVRALNDNYVYPETAKKMEAVHGEQMTRGEYDKVTNPRQLAIKLTNHFFEVCHDRHLRVNFSQTPIPLPGPNAGPSADEKTRHHPLVLVDDRGQTP
jgi:hypothetical protein